ncbi:hypothetical protein D3C80_1863460 [compost metagenome]
MVDVPSGRSAPGTVFLILDGIACLYFRGKFHGDPGAAAAICYDRFLFCIQGESRHAECDLLSELAVWLGDHRLGRYRGFKRSADWGRIISNRNNTGFSLYAGRTKVEPEN